MKDMERKLFGMILSELRSNMKGDPTILIKYHTSGVWTPIIKGLVEKTIKQYFTASISEQSLKIEHEYLRLDSLAVQYVYQSANGTWQPYMNHQVGDKDFWLYKRKYLVAAEYENGNTIWADEVDKLAHVRCGLKIVVAYSPWYKKNRIKYLQVLEEKAKLVTDCIRDIEPDALDDKWLLVFLPAEELDLDYAVAFKMDGGKFAQISE